MSEELRYYIGKIVQLDDEMASLGCKTFLYPAFSGGQSIPSDPNTGLPLVDYCFSYRVATPEQHAAMAADPDIYPLPDYPQCAKVSAIADDVRAQMWADLAYCGWVIEPLQGIDGYRELLQAIVVQRGSGFYLPS